MNNRNFMYDLKPFLIYWGVLVLACVLFFICPLLGILILPMLLIIIPVWLIIVYMIGNAVQRKSGLKQIRKRIVLSLLCAFLTTMIFPVGLWIYDAVKWNEFHLDSLIKNFEDMFLWIMFTIHFLAFWLGEEIEYLSNREHKK